MVHSSNLGGMPSGPAARPFLSFSMAWQVLFVLPLLSLSLTGTGSHQLSNAETDRNKIHLALTFNR